MLTIIPFGAACLPMQARVRYPLATVTCRAKHEGVCSQKGPRGGQQVRPDGMVTGGLCNKTFLCQCNALAEDLPNGGRCWMQRKNPQAEHGCPRRRPESRRALSTRSLRQFKLSLANSSCDRSPCPPRVGCRRGSQAAPRTQSDVAKNLTDSTMITSPAPAGLLNFPGYLDLFRRLPRRSKLLSLFHEVE